MDLLSSFPYSYIIDWATPDIAQSTTTTDASGNTITTSGSSSTNSNSNTSSVYKAPQLLRMLRIMRFLRILRLLRVLKLRKLLMRIEDYMSMSMSGWIDPIIIFVPSTINMENHESGHP